MNHKASLLSIDKEIIVEEGETLLDAALRQGVDYPHSCRTGRCGVCKSRLSSGEAEHLNHLRFTLTEQEKADGLGLACRAAPKSDVKAAWLVQEEQPRFRIKGQVIEKSCLTHDPIRLVLELTETARFHFGQYALLRIPGLEERSYPMANRSHGRALVFFIRKVPDRCVSGYIAHHLKAGDKVEVEGPFGTSYLRTDHRTQHRVGRLDQVIFSDWKTFEGSWQAYVAAPSSG